MLAERIREGVERLADERLDGRRRHVVAAAAALDTGEIQHVVDEPRQTLALARDDAVVLLPAGIVGHAAHLERLAIHPDHGQRSLEIVGHVGDEVGLEPGHLRLPSHQAAYGDDTGGDDDDEDRERSHADADLAADGGHRRRPARLIDRDAPAREPVAERHRRDEIGPVERPLAVDRAARRVHDRIDGRRLLAGKQRFEHLAAQAFRAARDSDQHRSTAVAEHRGEHRDLAHGDLAAATAVFPSPGHQHAQR